DEATVTFYYHGDVQNPTLFFFDPVSHSFKAYEGEVKFIANPDPADPTLHALQVTFNKHTTPAITDLGGTVFTVAISTEAVATTTTVSPLTVSLLQSSSSLQTTFSTNSQLALSLSSLQQSQLSSSRSDLIGEGLQHNGGTEEEPTDPEAVKSQELLMLINEV